MFPLDPPHGREAHALLLAFSLNGGMFLIEAVVAWQIGSSSLFADSLDMLADAVLYAVSWLTLRRPHRRQLQAAQLHAGLHALLALLLLADVGQRIAQPQLPAALPMSVLTVLALLVNIGSALLLHRFRDGDLNLRAGWLCSRNDALGNLAILLAAALVQQLQQPWPDWLVAVGMAALMLHTACSIDRAARQQRRVVLS